MSCELSGIGRQLDDFRYLELMADSLFGLGSSRLLENVRDPNAIPSTVNDASGIIIAATSGLINLSWRVPLRPNYIRAKRADSVL